MIEVSEKFVELSKQNGRQVSCKIVAGGETFLDDRLIEFDFDDVIFPNWFTVGTSCSNRFAFSVRYSGELEVHDEVRPYISFDGEEWCPLGVFYVARRYVRGDYASIICYDRMYSLEMEYVPTVSDPTDAQAILEDICTQHGIVCAAGVLYPHKVGKLPVGATVRDVLGFVAGVDVASAKFDREGNLRMKRYRRVEPFNISGKNCMDYSRNMTGTKITHMTVDTGDEILEAGKGGELATLELYNPLMTQNLLDATLPYFYGMVFYGADIEMQGFPYLESGDYVRLRDKDDELYPIAVGEIDFHYDGGLTARVYSRTRTYTDAAIHQDDLSAALEKIRADLGNICLKSVNSNDINITPEGVSAAKFEFNTRVSGTFAQVDLNFTLDGAGTVRIAAYVNDKLVREGVHETEGAKELVHFYFLAEKLPQGSNVVSVIITAESGEMSIKSGGLTATLVCRGAAGGESEKIRDRQLLSDKMQRVSISAVLGVISISDSFGLNLNENTGG